MIEARDKSHHISRRLQQPVHLEFENTSLSGPSQKWNPNDQKEILAQVLISIEMEFGALLKRAAKVQIWQTFQSTALSAFC
ncbi:hypothetical protein [uncultured Roseobacter sp.]|uniref:hypothetical protein n=1 Tax=uncultured Roseobacter sp. TaxID=114847 RepID=UPI0026253DCE|nr:hypothetical protein [uncultured Roseobacter sp.]